MPVPADTAPETRSAASAIDAGAPQSLHDLLDTATWFRFVEGIGLSGISREILMNLVPRAVDGSVLTACLDQASRALFNPQRQKRLEGECARYLGYSLQFEIEVVDLAEAIPERESSAQRQARMQAEAQEDARRSFTTDQHVRDLVSRFDGEVMVESIRREEPADPDSESLPQS